MTSLVVTSNRDPAAETISTELRNLKKFQATPSKNLFQSGDVYLQYVDTDSIYTDTLSVEFKPEVVIFASKHRSETNDPALTVHWTGNNGSKADFGGKPKSLSQTDPSRLRAAFLALDRARESRNLNYTVTLEATHHGPTELGIPTLFVEVGSTEREWKDKAAGTAAAEAIWAAASNPLNGRAAVGFGGGHYCNKHCSALRNDGYAFSHIFSKYFFEEYDPAIVSMSFNQTKGGCSTAVLDWKGVQGSVRQRLLEDLKRMNVEIVRV